MNKKTFQIGDLVDVHRAVKRPYSGLAVIIDHEYEDDEKYYTLLWSDGQVSIAHRKNIQLAE